MKSRSPVTPITTGTDRHAQRRIASTESLPCCRYFLLIPESAAVAQRRSGRKTIVSSQMIDRVTAKLGRKLCEVPVGFKWFVDGLLHGRSGSVARKAPGPRFSVAMARSGRRTRMHHLGLLARK